MDQETVLPEAPESAGASDQPAEVETLPEGEAEKTEAKPEKHPLEKELAKERRRNQALARRTHEAERVARELQERLQPREIGDTNRTAEADSEVLSLSKAELQRLIEQKAAEIAPTISKQKGESERLSKAAAALREALGDEFPTLTEDLASVFDGKKQLAVLRTEAPAELIRYLTDPDNADEAERIAGMDDFDAGRALAKLELKLQSKDDKPKPSKAGSPLRPVRGQGEAVERVPTDIHQYMAWANKKYGRV